MIKAKGIEFYAPETPNVITALIPKHDRGVNAIDDDMFVASVDELATPLLTIKKNLLQAGLFPSFGEGCHLCLSLPDGCHLLKGGIQCLMDDKEIMFEKTPVTSVPCEDVSIITISANPPKVSSKRPVRITSFPKVLR